MILEIKTYPHISLKQKCKKVFLVSNEEKMLVRDMLETMYKSGGVGLAAPQVGILKRVIVVDVGSGPIALFNPEIVKRYGKAKSEEGCLSVPGVILKIDRAEEVEVKGLNERNKVVRIKANGILSYVLQHEIDHLDGILILDRISYWEKIKRKIGIKEKNK